MLDLVTWQVPVVGGIATHYSPVVHLAGAAPIHWRGQAYVAVTTDWDAAGVRQLLVADHGRRIPAVEAVLRQMLGADYDSLTEAVVWEVVTLALRAIKQYRRQHATGCVRMESNQRDVLHLAAHFFQAHSPDVPVTYVCRDDVELLTLID